MEGVFEGFTEDLVDGDGVPVLVRHRLVPGRPVVLLLHGHPRLIWRAWAEDVSGHGLDAGHHVAEEAPEELAVALAGFLRAGG